MRDRCGLMMVLWLIAVFANPVHAHEPVASDDRWWRDEAWWERGEIANNANYQVTTRWVTYKNGEQEVRAYVARPAKAGRFPGFIFVHGRRGLDDLIQAKVRRLAARGFVVFAPALYASRFMDPMPYKHDYILEGDVNAGVDAFFRLQDITNRKKTCLVSHTRGGYYTLKVAVSFRRQADRISCYVSWYPHMQDPNAPEPAQVYGYAPEADGLRIPVLIFIGEHEQYQRRRPIESAVSALRGKRRNARLLIYPGVGRGFDFRPEHVRSFADDLAAKDANRRAAIFILKYLK